MTDWNMKSLKKGSAGFLGIGMKQAVIEARRKPEPVAEVKEETIPVEEVKPSVVKEQVSEPVQEKQEEKAEEERQERKLQSWQKFLMKRSKLWKLF